MTEEEAVVEVVNDFGRQISGIVNSERGCIIIGVTNLVDALSMLYGISEGETYRLFQRNLFHNVPAPVFKRYFQEWNHLGSTHRWWFGPDHSDWRTFDASKGVEEVKRINDEIHRRTLGAVRDLLPVDLFSPVCRIRIFNVVIDVLKNGWLQPFDQRLTHNGHMREFDQLYSYCETATHRFLEKQHFCPEFSVGFVQAKHGTRVPPSIPSRDEFVPTRFSMISMPKILFETSLSLAELQPALTEMGLDSLFTRFSPDLVVSHAFHRATFELTEGDQSGFGSPTPNPAPPTPQTVFHCGDSSEIYIVHQPSGLICWRGFFKVRANACPSAEP